MAEFCFVVERVEWDEDRGQVTPGSEVSDILKVFRNDDDVKSYVESNAAANYPGFEFQWHGGHRYSARSEEYGSGWKEGVKYEIHYVPLS